MCVNSNYALSRVQQELYQVSGVLHHTLDFPSVNISRVLELYNIAVYSNRYIPLFMLISQAIDTQNTVCLRKHVKFCQSTGCLMKNKWNWIYLSMTIAANFQSDSISFSSSIAFNLLVMYLISFNIHWKHFVLCYSSL